MKQYVFIFLCILQNIIYASPVAVTNGGTGTTSFAVPYAIICGGITNIDPFQTTGTAGTSGQALISAGAGALPAYGTLSIAGGGTGAASLSSGVIQSNGSILSSLGIGSTNQVIQNVAGTVGWAFTNILQMVSTSTTAIVDTASSVIPDDDTIPQNTEGTQILTLAITPKSASSNLLILFATGGTPTGSDAAIAALFVDSTANALAAQYISASASAEAYSGTLEYFVASASTTSRTYKIRIGCSSSATSFKVNGNGSGRVFGGVASTMLIIIEFA